MQHVLEVAACSVSAAGLECISSSQQWCGVCGGNCAAAPFDCALPSVPLSAPTETAEHSRYTWERVQYARWPLPPALLRHPFVSLSVVQQEWRVVGCGHIPIYKQAAAVHTNHARTRTLMCVKLGEKHSMINMHQLHQLQQQ